MRIFGHRPSISVLIGLGIIVLNLLLAVFSPVLAPHGEAELIGDVWAPPSPGIWLGLDNLGRDMLSRLLYGARTTIGIAFLITLLSFVIGVTSGFAAAAIGGWVDAAVSRAVDALM